MHQFISSFPFKTTGLLLLGATFLQADPVVQTQPQSRTVNQGQAVMFTLAATGSGALSYQWQKDGVDIPGATGSSFSLASAQPWQIGDYRVKVTDSVGTVTSQVAALNLSGVNSGIWRGLIGFYELDGSPADLSPIAREGTNFGSNASANRFGVAGRASSFNGSSYISVPSAPITGRNSFSISFWASVETQPNGTEGWQIAFGQPLPNQGFHIGNRGYGATKMYGEFWADGDFADTPLVSFEYSKYFQFVATFDGTKISTFKNGALVGSSTHDLSGVNLQPGSLQFGKQLTINEYFKGVLDTVRIYNRALSGAEVQALYASEATVQFTAQPQSQTVNQGQAVTLSVAASGVGSLSYQWQKDGVDIPGATGSSFSLASAQPWQIGDYRVKVTDSVGTVTSEVATLSLSGVNSGIWKGLVSYYPMDGNPNDVSTFEKHGIPTRITYLPDRFGVASRSANFENIPADQGSSVEVPGLKYQPFKPVTYSMWVRFEEINNFSTLIGRKQTWNQEDGALMIYNKNITYHTGRDGAYANFIPATNVWTKIDFTYDENNLVIFYVNGNAIHQQYFGATQTAGLPFRIGAETVLQGINGNNTGSLNGQVDDVRIYNRALSGAEVQALYASEATVQFTAQPQSQTVNQGQPATFTVVATGSGSLSYQWQKDGVDIPGATGSSFSLASAQPWHIGDYTVKVTDSVGTVTSEVATLSLNGANSGIWKGLVAYYPMDGNFEDSSPRKNNLDTLNQFSLGNDRFGISNKAASINASTGKAVSKYPVGIAGNSKRSVSLWVQTNSSLNNDCDLISWSRYLSPANAQGFLMQLTAGNGGQIYVWGHYADISAKDLGDPFINQWSHIVYSYDGSTSAQGRVYLNGALLTNTLLSGDVPFITEDTALKIGDRGLGMAKSGTKIDDVRIYNRALSASDVQALYAFESNPAPTIAQHPSSQTVRVGGTVTLGVQATGSGTLTYQWRKGGVDLPQATGASLELVNLTLADAGSYDVVVSNGAASVTSNAAVLTVLHAPTISMIEDVTLSEDGTLGPLAFSIADLDTSVEQLSISATSSLPVLVQEAAIQLAGTGTSRTLTLSPVPNASGVVTITLRVSDGVLETTESFVLTVQAVPDAPTELTLTPASLAENNAPNAVVGTLAALDVDAGDSHSFTLVPGAGSTDNGSFTVLGSNLRMTPSADYETKSSYAIRLRATDGAGLWVERALMVTVQNINEPPTLSGAATVAMIEDGLESRPWSVADVDTDVATLTLSATATTNSALLPLGRVSFGGSGSSRTVTMDPVEGQTGVATLTLSVSDGGLSTTATMTVTVHEKDIVIAQQPQSQEVSELSEARFSVQLTSGGEFATYQWQRNNQPIQGATQPELILPSAILSQAGNYQVVITNPQTSLASSQAVLLVRVLPEIKQQPESILVNAGDSAGFAVSALGRPTLSYQWRRNGADVSGARSASLDFSAVTMAQAGRYQVRIRNPANTTGILSREVELGVVESYAISRTIKMQQGKSVKLTVTAAGNGLTYRWHKDGAAVSSNGRNKGWDTRELTIDSVTNEDEGDYECKIMAPGGIAWGALTTVKVFNLKPKIQRPLLMDDAMVGKSYEFTVPLDMDNGGEATSYTATGLPPGLKINPATGVISGKPTVAKADGYFVKIAAINSLGRDEETAGMAVAPLLPGTAGTYAAIIRPEGRQSFPVLYLPELYGRLDLTVLSTAAYSGSLTLGGLRMPVSGVLDADADLDPVGNFTLKRTGKPDIQGQFTLIPASGRPRQLTGNVTGVSETRELEVLGWRQPWSSAVRATAYDGIYNMVGERMLEEEGLFDPVLGHPVPASPGYLNFTVGLNGVYLLAGRMGDGERVTSSAFLSDMPVSQAVLYSYISASKGCLAGVLQCGAESSDGARDNRASASSLSWNRAPGGSSSRLYRAGFSDVGLNLYGGQYVPPAKGELLLDSVSQPLVLNNAKLDFDGGGAANQPAITFSILADGKLAMPTSATRTTLSITAATGMFRGSFVLTELNPFTRTGIPQSLTRTVSFEGLIVPDRWINPASPGRRAYGSGFFVMPQMPSSVTETLSNTRILGGQVTITNKQ